MIQEFEQFLENAYDFQEALERQKIKKEDLDALREMIKRSKLVPRYIHDKQLLLFMNATKDNVERSSKWIHVYYKLKKNSPEFFTNRDVFSPEIQNALNNQFYVTLPVTPDGCNVIFHGLISHDPKKYVFDDVIKTFIMTAEARTFQKGPRDGTIFIYDLKGSGFKHLLRPTVSSVRKGIEFLQSGSPLNVTSILVFNATALMDLIFAMIKPFLKKELYERIHLHKIGTDYAEFYQKFIPRSHMPSDYGGNLESLKELHEQNRKLLSDTREYFIMEEQQMKLYLEEHANDKDVDDDDNDDFINTNK